MSDTATCPRCSRVRWHAYDGAIDGSMCHFTGGFECVTVGRVNALVAVAKKALNGPVDDVTRRTLLAIVEDAAPSSHRCPKCERPHAVFKNVVKVHYATNLDKRPCDASYHRVLGGTLLP